jgi:hypothetical protein
LEDRRLSKSRNEKTGYESRFAEVVVEFDFWPSREGGFSGPTQKMIGLQKAAVFLVFLLYIYYSILKNPIGPMNPIYIKPPKELCCE